MAKAFSVDHMAAGKVEAIATFKTAGLKWTPKQGKIK
jgi:hypothetical protein